MTFICWSWQHSEGPTFVPSAGEAVSLAQDVVKTMVAKGYVLGVDAVGKAKAFDESHQVYGLHFPCVFIYTSRHCTTTILLMWICDGDKELKISALFHLRIPSSVQTILNVFRSSQPICFQLIETHFWKQSCIHDQVSATAVAKVAELSERIGLTDKLFAGVEAARIVDQRYHITDTTKSAVSATGRTAASAASAVVNSTYFSKGALWFSGALSKAAQAAADLGTRNASHWGF